MTLTFICDVTVLALFPRKNERKPFDLKGGKPYKVSNVKFSGASVAFTLSRGQRVTKLPTKYLQR